MAAISLGWVTSFTPKLGDVSLLEPIQTLQLSFDLKHHTAQSLVQMLAFKRAESLTVRRRRESAVALPKQAAGKRPQVRPEDGPSASRHRLVTEPATLKLVFNCYNAELEVTDWTNKHNPFDKLPLEQSFDLCLKGNRQAKLGRIKLAYSLSTTFLERVEFPNQWLLAEEYGVTNDGWQGGCMLELELVWAKDVATIKVRAWLAYATTVGARVATRRPGNAYGQSATVQRILGDDRVVARIDSYSKSDGVRGEVIVDLTPSNVVRTAFPHYERGTRLLLLHEGHMVDASVLHWLGALDPTEGSRHMVLLRSHLAKTGTQAWHDLNEFNHVVVPAEMSAEVYEQRRTRYCHFLLTTEDNVEDAITGNMLKIKDQLIFLDVATVPGGCNPPQYDEIHTVPQLIAEQIEASPKRPEGTHNAQPVLIRAGPGTGKTWAIKQALLLLAEALAGDESAAEGVRMMPVIIFVQRIVRLLREHGDDPQELLENPNGLMRWYIACQYAERKEERDLLLVAYDMRAVTILVDGIDEAAGMRDIIEAFVHYELIPSGCRCMITSRPEGVDIDDYKTSFVMMNLRELSEDQQRTVIQMQLAGNAFFEHLVNIAECRKDLDRQYRELFPRSEQRSEIEGVRFHTVELTEAEMRASDAQQEAQQAIDALDDDEDNEDMTMAADEKLKLAELETCLR